MDPAILRDGKRKTPNVRRERAKVAAAMAEAGASIKEIGEAIGMKTPESIRFAIRRGKLAR